MTEAPAARLPETDASQMRLGPIDASQMRPTWCDIDLDALDRNLAAIRRHVGEAEVVPVVKANAYGHGIAHVGLALAAAGVACVAVAYVEEALALRAAGVTIDIHVLGGAVERQIPLFLAHNLILTAPSIDKLRQIDEAAIAAGTTARAHLKIDTGMERIGVHHYNADKLFAESLRCRSVRVEGVFSHFANADAPDLSDARTQLDRFNEAVSFYERHSLPTPVRHMAASAAIARLPEAHLDRVRPGILLYGVAPKPEIAAALPTEPVLSWHSEIVYFKVVPPGASVGYGSTWTADRQTRVITLPVGYADGYARSLGTGPAHDPGQGPTDVLIDGVRHRVVGNVCMDQTMVDIGDASAYNGDRVTLIGSQGSERVTVTDLADWSGRSPYEVLTGISLRVPRVHRSEAEPLGEAVARAARERSEQEREAPVDAVNGGGESGAGH
ncbi:alanine racemase [Candidatus Poriferisodalis sp.]|uniref:alanine racemase n=1 Tax=Candidatus Poriferisodalis sp. TaxID=3101277 RepID=UPI003B02456A